MKTIDKKSTLKKADQHFCLGARLLGNIGLSSWHRDAGNLAAYTITTCMSLINYDA